MDELDAECEALWGPAPPYRSPLPVEEVEDVKVSTCLRCGHQWEVVNPDYCPKCRSHFWDRLPSKARLGGGRK